MGCVTGAKQNHCTHIAVAVCKKSPPPYTLTTHQANQGMCIEHVTLDPVQDLYYYSVILAQWYV